MVSVLFFGAASGAAGTRKAAIELTADLQADDLFRQIVSEFPGLGKHRLLMAVNQEYATGGEIIRNGDEIAIFTAVSGG